MEWMKRLDMMFGRGKHHIKTEGSHATAATQPVADFGR
jgi:hypothetical protein